MPATCVLAIEGNYLDVVPKSHKPAVAEALMDQLPSTEGKVDVYSVRLEPGDVIIWRGDLFHRGAVSGSRDLRLLWHVYSPSMKMVDDKLYNTVQEVD